MSFCSKCGTEIAPEAAFCSKCGAAINEAASRHAQRGTNAAKRPSDVLAWFLAIAPLPIVFLPDRLLNIIGWAVILLALIDAVSLVKKNGYVDTEQLLAKKGYKPVSLRLWAFFLYPVYLFKRARLLDQKPIHFIVWCVAFSLAVILAIFTINSHDQEFQAIGGGTHYSYPMEVLKETAEDSTAHSMSTISVADMEEVLTEYKANADKAQAKFGGKRFRFTGNVVQLKSSPNGNIQAIVIDLRENLESELMFGSFVAIFDASAKKTLTEGKGLADERDGLFQITFDGTITMGKVEEVEYEYEDKDNNSVRLAIVVVADCKLVTEPSK